MPYAMIISFTNPHSREAAIFDFLHRFGVLPQSGLLRISKGFTWLLLEYVGHKKVYVANSLTIYDTPHCLFT